MHAVADTNQLVRDGIISETQATDIEARARDAMVALVINLAPEAMMLSGALISVLSIWALAKRTRASRFVSGSVLLMGGALHLGGIYLLLEDTQAIGWTVGAAHLYCFAALIVAGWATNFRMISALAIVPFAQLLDAGTFYSHAVYAFYSHESTLTILQMSALIALCIWVANRWPERIARHARVLAVMAFITANLCALVGSLWGDVVGQTIWGPGHYAHVGRDGWREALDAFKASTLVISEEVYAILWAGALGAIAIWASHKNQRGLFNAALTFGGIHAYTQLMTYHGDKPLAFAKPTLAPSPHVKGNQGQNRWNGLHNHNPWGDSHRPEYSGNRYKQ